MISLSQGSTVAGLWSITLAPALTSMMQRAWSDTRPVAIVTPSPMIAQSLKEEMYRAKLPIVGVEFWQPDDLRREFARAFKMPMPIDDVRLVAAGIRSVAQVVVESEPDNATAVALSRSAQALAETLAMLETAGWDHQGIHAEPLKSLAMLFASAKQERGQQSRGEFDFDVLRRARTEPGKLFGATLLFGFDGMHWEHWPILASAAVQSCDSVVTLPMAFATSGEADMVWCSSWEQLAEAPCDPISEDAPANVRLATLSSHIDGMNTGRIMDAYDMPVSFFASENLTEEARKVALMASRLIQKGEGPVAILVPGAGPLAREITLALARKQIVHYTSLPGKASPVPHAGSWPALLDALGAGTADAACVFLRSNGHLAKSFTGGKESEEIAVALERVTAETLVSDMRVLRTLARGQHGEVLAPFFGAWPDLPKTASMGEYFDAVERLLLALEWNELALSVAEARRQHKAALAMPLSAEAICEWLCTALPAHRVYRNDYNGNPYALIQVLTPPEAIGRHWGHIIFAGQTEGSWPPPLKPAGYLGEEAVRALNNGARALNQQATTEGIFGEGMTVVRSDRGYCVGPLDERAMHVRDLIRLLNSAEWGVAFSAALIDESDSNRALQPGDFYRRVYLACTGLAVDAGELCKIAKSEVYPTWALLPSSNSTPVDQVRTAWTARNRGDRLSEYEFTLGGVPADFPVSISPSAWGKAFDTPAEVFLGAYLGVRKPTDMRSLPTRSAMGIWAHRLVESTAKSAEPGDEASWDKACIAAAREEVARMENALLSVGRTVPAWWRSLFAQALSKARHFAREAGKASAGFNVLVEQSIPKVSVKLPSGRFLRVGGRVDMIITDSVPDPRSMEFAGGSQKLPDFKTGSEKPLRGVKSLEKLDGLQPALYLLAVKALGGGQLEGGFIVGGETWAPQISDRDLSSPEAIRVFERLAQMQDEGEFGWCGIVRDPYSAGCAYPIATLSPVINITEKYDRTHGF